MSTFSIKPTVRFPSRLTWLPCAGLPCSTQGNRVSLYPFLPVHPFRECFGRRNVGSVNLHAFPLLSLDHDFSAALTSLPCSLQINMESTPPAIINGGESLLQMPVSSPADPNWIGEFLFEAFKESRRIVDAIQQSVTFVVGVSTGFIAPMLVIMSLLNLPPFFRVSEGFVRIV